MQQDTSDFLSIVFGYFLFRCLILNSNDAIIFKLYNENAFLPDIQVRNEDFFPKNTLISDER